MSRIPPAEQRASVSIVQAIRDVTERHAASPFIVDGRSGETLTYGETFDLACRLAARLGEEGIGPGDRVCVLAENSPAVVLAYFALLYLGASLVPVTPTLAGDDLRFVLEMARSRAVLASISEAPRVAALPPEARPAVHILGWVGQGPLLDGTSVASSTPVAPYADASPDDEFCVTFTSGSTAFPKGVVHTIASLFGNAMAFDIDVGLGQQQRFLHILPMSYMAGLLNLIVCPFMAGASLVVAPEFSARSILDFWELPIRNGTNAYWLVPTMIAMLLRADRDRRASSFLRASAPHIFVGTAPLPAEAKREFEARYGVPLRPSYGTSELLLITVNSPERGHRDDSVGAAIRDVVVEARDRDATGVGELVVRTPFRSAGYLREPADPPLGGWSATGDLGVVLPDGQVLVTGRKKELIISGGINVSPLAVERVVNEHPGVELSAAVGVPDPILGEVVIVAVRARAGHRFEDVKRDLARLARERLAPAQRPVEIVEVDTLPVTAMGKVKRAAVREEMLRRVRR